MKKILVWDIPIRIFHWAFAICIAAALFIALTIDDDSPLFNYHMLFGLTAGFLLLIRILIGIFGRKYSKFSGLIFNPVETVKYLNTSIFGSSKYYAGHNPGTAAAAIIMFLMVAGLIVTGLNINYEVLEDIHPLFAYILIAAISVHLLGIILFTARHKENIAMSIINGRKNGPDEAAIKSAQGIPGLLLILVLAGWIVLLNSYYNSADSTINIPFTNKTIMLGEDEGHNSEYEYED